MIRELRHAVRTLITNPGFTVVAVLTLALGIGANTAIFSVVSGVLLRPLPYPEPERLVTLWERNPLKGIEQENVSPPDLADWRQQQSSFERLAFWTGPTEFNLVNTDGVEKVRAAYVSSDLFPVLRVEPLLGRVLQPEEDQREGNRAAVICYAFWQRRFGGDPDAIGRTLTMDTFGRRDYTIVGVLPPGFRFPDQTEIWLPAGWNGLGSDRRGGPWLSVLARLKDGVGISQARAEMDAIQGLIAEQYPTVAIGTHVSIVPLLDQMLGARVRPALLILWGIVACVLLIACANVANLSLARAAARSSEIAIRLALGATRLSIVRQLLTESLVLACFGGALGALLASGLLRLIVAFNSGHIPRLHEARLDGGALLFTLLITVATGVIFGFAPAWQFSRPDLTVGLKSGGRGARGGLQRSRFRRTLVVAQVTLTSVLLVAAGLMTRSFVQLMGIDRGFQSGHLLTANMDFSVQGFTTWIRPTGTRPQVTLKEIMAGLEVLPGVQAVGAIGGLPRGTSAARGQGIFIEGRDATAPDSRLYATFHGVTPDYFRAMAIPLVSGRSFTDGDTLEGQPVAVINETLARRYFPNEDPVGKRFAMGGRKPGELAMNPLSQSPWIEIVGVVGDVKRLTLEAATMPDVFRPYWQWPMQTPTLVVRTGADTASIAAAIQSEARAVNKNVPPPSVREMGEILADVVAQPRFYTVLSGMFGITAVLLAAVGIYGVMSYSVTQRRLEIGIRMALGARAIDILRMFISQGMALVAIGVALGLAGAWALTRVMVSLLIDISATDSLTFASTPLLLALVALAACYLPARRATQVEPMVALRQE
jgi:putative ABC transport system permease protein